MATSLPCAWCGRWTTTLDADGDPACSGQCTPRAPKPPRLVTVGSEKLTLRDLARSSGVRQSVLKWRLSSGWDAGRAATTPVGTHGGYRRGVPGGARQARKSA